MCYCHLNQAPPSPGLMMRVEDVIIKTLLCGVQHISSACTQFQPHRGNCFGEHCTQKSFYVTVTIIMVTTLGHVIKPNCVLLII